MEPESGTWRHRCWQLRWPRSQRTRGLLSLLLGTALISVMDAVVELMSISLGTLQIAWGRDVAQAILLFPVISPRHPSIDCAPGTLDHLFRVGLLRVCTLLFFGVLRTMSRPEANAIAFTSPLVVTALSGVILGEAVGV